MTGKHLVILAFIISFFSIAIHDVFAFNYNYDFTVDSAGIVTGEFTKDDPGLVNNRDLALDPEGTTLCIGGTAGLSGANVVNYTGFNVFTDGGVGESNCASPGYYYFVTRSYPALLPVAFYSVYYDGSVIYPGTEAQNTNIYATILKPQPYGTTTSSTTVQISVTFKFNGLFDFDVPPAFRVGYRVYDAVTNVLETQYTNEFPENTNVFYTYSTTTTLLEGSKTIEAFIEELDGTPLTTPDDTFFNVITNTYLEATGLNNPRENPASLTQIDCDTFDVGCQFQKALTFLFMPSQTTLDRFAALWQRVRNKVPFGYVTVVIDQLEGLDGGATPAFDLGDIPFMSTIFDPFRTLLGGIMWGLFAIYFYQRRLTKLDI